MIEAAQAAQVSDQQQLSRLLQESARLLWPLDDPFSVDFGLHRWLSGVREEVYSDWLAWIIGELDNAADVFRLLGLDIPSYAAHWKNASATREAPIPDGRLDIVLRWPDRALLVVEVKLTDEESASTVKQSRYRKWMDKQGEPYKVAALLIVDAVPGCSKGGFRRLDWREVCLRLRSMAVDRLIRRMGDGAGTDGGHIVRASLMLGFAGAAEQNLLGMPSKPLKLMEKGCLLNVLDVLKFLKDFHMSVCR